MPAAIRVLVVDDDEDLTGAFQDFFEAHGYETRTAIDPSSALRIAGDFLPSVVFVDVDLGLPTTDGCTLAPHLRAIPRLKPFLVAITGFEHPEILARACRAGFDRVMLKPLSPSQLLDVLGNRKTSAVG